MNREELVKCPNCGYPLTAEHRKGNVMRCPACKTIFEIKMKSSQKLGKCPHRCGEMMRVDDYVDGVRLQCVHCHGYSFTRVEGTNELWSPTQGGVPVLYKYLGSCPICGEPIEDANSATSRGISCSRCDGRLVTRPNYQISEKIGDCPICGDGLGKCDIGDGDKCKCVNCKQIISLDHTAVPEGNLIVRPDLTADEFKYKCFKLLYDNAPADIASKMQILQVKLSFVPFTYGMITAKTTVNKFNFEKYDERSVMKDFGGSVEFTECGGTRCYLPRYELVYNYKGQEWRFWMTQGDNEVQYEKLPKSKRLLEDSWIKKWEVNLVQVLFLIVDGVWWWKSSHGFLSCVGHLALAIVFYFVFNFLLKGICALITKIMRSWCQKHKDKEFKSYHGCDYSAKINN